MKFTTANSKNCDYKDSHLVYVGTQTGSFKRVDTYDEDKPYRQTNLQSLDTLTKDSKITCMRWKDESKNEILIGRADKIVRTFDCGSNKFANDIEVINGSSIVGLAYVNGSTVVATDNGKIHIIGETTKIIESGNHLSKMRQCQQNTNLLAVGGREKENHLQIFDLTTQEKVFGSKNVPHDTLQLEVPVWDCDIAFIDEHCLATCSRHGYIRFYDRRVQRRPMLNYTDKKDFAFTTMAESNGVLFVGTTIGGLFGFDQRTLKTPLHTYKGFTGSITDVGVDPSGKFVYTSSLDRYVRVHGVDNTHLLYQCYVKSKASQILLKNVDPEVLKEESTNGTPVEKDEYDEIFDKMQTVTEPQADEEEIEEVVIDKKRKLNPFNARVSEKFVKKVAKNK